MRLTARLALAGLTAGLALAAFVSTASANSLSPNEPHFIIKWPPPLESGEGERITVDCAITLEGSFSATTFAKATGRSIGLVTEFRRSECEGGDLTILRETLPWTISYQSFSGTLPRIATVTIDVINAAFRMIETFGFSCLFRTTTTNPSRLIALLEGGVVRSLRADEAALIPMAFPCEQSQARFIGVGTMTRPEGRAFVINLI